MSTKTKGLALRTRTSTRVVTRTVLPPERTRYRGRHQGSLAVGEDRHEVPRPTQSVRVS